MNLIVEITLIDDEEKLCRYEELFEKGKKGITEKQRELLKKLAKPIRKNLDIEELKKEQNWKPTSAKEIEEIVKDFNWEISDEEFIEVLKSI